jgi:hypothetical protein
LKTTDLFGTATNVYAPQVGTHVGWALGRFSADLTGKFAMGTGTQAVAVAGSSLLFPPPGPLHSVAALGGILAQPTNMPGQTIHGRFVVVPEVNGRLAYEVFDGLRLWAGYSFLYVSDVVRPGNQIDRTVNPTQVPSDQLFGAFAGPARPALEVHHTSFWAHGVNFGLEVQF